MVAVGKEVIVMDEVALTKAQPPDEAMVLVTV
jgi:hypothetical protein